LPDAAPRSDPLSSFTVQQLERDELVALIQGMKNDMVEA
jgi:hypothetical protein